jgi:hypothetical protein
MLLLNRLLHPLGGLLHFRTEAMKYHEAARRTMYLSVAQTSQYLVGALPISSSGKHARYITR